MNFSKHAAKRGGEAGSDAGRCHRAAANLIGGSGRQRRVLLPSEQPLRPRSAAGAAPRARYDAAGFWVNPFRRPIPSPPPFLPHRALYGE